MRRFAAICFTVLPFALASDLCGQEVGEQSGLGAGMDREALVRQLEELELFATSPVYSERLRRQIQWEADLLRGRLEQGDFRVGDRVLLSVEGETELSKTYAVDSNRSLTLPLVGEVPLAGVLRSEIQGHLEIEIARYVRDPVVRAWPLIRLSMMGSVARPGFYSVPGDALISDALMLAGGPGAGAQLDGLRIERGVERVWGRDRLRTAMMDGSTLGELGLQNGDEIFVPTRTSRGFTIIRLIPMIIAVPFSVIALVQIF
jgi:protein involved in polysaccharide export with SLBB domain